MSTNKGFYSVFPAFKSRNFKLYFFGQSISLVGTWLQVVAEGLLVLTLTKSPLMIGLVAAAATLPTLILSPFGGVIVDHFSKKKIILLTQGSSMVLALIYGILTITGHINIWEIMILALLLGVVNALDFPARQAFTVDVVEKENLSSAIAINAGTFNAARAVGPGMAGILIAFFGIGGAFIINGLSYIASISAMYRMDIEEKKPSHFEDPIKSLKEGFTYSFSHPKIRALLLFTSVVAIFGWSYTTLLPLISETVFKATPAELGYMFSAAGVGAVIAMVLLSILSKKVGAMNFIFMGSVIFSVSLFCFTFVNHLLPAYFFLFFSGFGLLLTFPTINTTIQHLVNDKIRGRVMGIWVMMFVGFFPIGNLEIGVVSEKLGPLNAVRIGMVIVLIAATILYLTRNKVEQQYKEHVGIDAFNEGEVNP